MKVSFQDKDFKKIIDFMYLVGVSALNISHALGKEEPDLEDSPLYNKSNLSITIPHNIDEEKLKYALLHELGHHLEAVKTGFAVRWLSQFGQLEEETIEEILQEEFKAWENAETVAGILGVKLGPGYKEFKALCLQTYQDQFNEIHKEQINPLKGKIEKPKPILKRTSHQFRGVLKSRG